MKILIYSKRCFDNIMKKNSICNDNVETLKNTFFISINDSFGTDEKPYFDNKSNVKVLFFDDVEKDIETNTGTAKAFTPVQAKELLEFINNNKDKQTCVIHCSAGISRSGAVGTFINDYTGSDYSEFKLLNPHILPNGLVLRMLKRVAFYRMGWY